MAYNPAIRMVPGPLWGLNLRKGRVIPKSQWDKIRTAFFEEHGLTCQTCGETEIDRKRLNVHEEWEYLTTTKKRAVARLAGLKISCWHCHMIEHFGALTNMVAAGELSRQAIDDTIEHFCRVNRVGRPEFDRHLARAKAAWMRHNQLEWAIDWGEFSTLVDETAQRREKGRQGLLRSRITQHMVPGVRRGVRHND
jgi:hypothetical protein